MVKGSLQTLAFYVSTTSQWPSDYSLLQLGHQDLEKWSLLKIQLVNGSGIRANMWTQTFCLPVSCMLLGNILWSSMVIPSAWPIFTCAQGELSLQTTPRCPGFVAGHIPLPPQVLPPLPFLQSHQSNVLPEKLLKVGPGTSIAWKKLQW